MWKPPHAVGIVVVVGVGVVAVVVVVPVGGCSALTTNMYSTLNERVHMLQW